jgi:hypothetical protein
VGEPPYREHCDCRKPRPGLLRRAEKELGADLRSSWVIGDRYSDMQLAWSVGAQGALVKSGYGLGELTYLSRAGRSSPTSWPRTCWRRSSASSAARRREHGEARGDRARLRGRRVLVLADLVADEFVYGKVERVSREAPVLILRHDTTDVRLGGGANAVHNIRTLGGRPLPFGLLGATRTASACARSCARRASARASC